MYAVFKSGGKQHRVEEGEIIRLEKLEGEPGDKVDFEEVLMVVNGDDVKIGDPMLKGGKVSAEVVEQGRGKKIEIVKFRRRKHSKTRTGHRQYYTAVKITGIKG